MIAPVTHVLPLTMIRRSRLLNTPGKVLVKVGQKVNSTDVIAETHLQGRHLLVDVRRALGLTRLDPNERLVDRQVGEKLQKGDVLAQTSGLFSRVVRAPADGVVATVTGGRVLLELDSPSSPLLAGMIGEVVEVIPELGAVLETNGALARCSWGNDKVDQGVMLNLINNPDEELQRSRIDVSMRGAVVLAGICTQADALRAAAELPLRGLILSSMTSDLIPLAEKLSFPIVLMEGFGKIPMNAPAFKLLSSLEKRDVVINAVNGEIIVPLPAGGSQAPETDVFKPGQTVRIHGAPYSGKVGLLVQIRPGLTRLPNGLRVVAGDVRLEEKTEVITVPLNNLDVFE
jgi:hypothetical protein